MTFEGEIQFPTDSGKDTVNVERLLLFTILKPIHCVRNRNVLYNSGARSGRQWEFFSIAFSVLKLLNIIRDNSVNNF